MYKRMLAAATAAIVVVLLVFVLGPMGVDALWHPRCHIVAQAR